MPTIHPTPPEAFGRALSVHCAMRCLQLPDLADELGVPLAVLEQIERGEPCAERHLLRVAEGLGLDATEVLRAAGCPDLALQVYLRHRTLSVTEVPDGVRALILDDRVTAVVYLASASEHYAGYAAVADQRHFLRDLDYAAALIESDRLAIVDRADHAEVMSKSAADLRRMAHNLQPKPGQPGGRRLLIEVRGPLLEPWIAFQEMLDDEPLQGASLVAFTHDFDRVQRLALLAAHPYLIVGGALYRNPSYHPHPRRWLADTLAQRRDPTS